MARPPIPGPGQGEDPDRDTGLPGAVPASSADRGRERPAGKADARGGEPSGGPTQSGGGRDGRLAAFADGGAGDRFPPGGWLAMTIDDLSGPGRRCPGATDDELTGLLARWAAIESWAAAAKLGVAAELVRRRARPGHAGRQPAGLPTAWEEGTGHEAAAALGMSIQGADKLIALAVTLQARLPGIYARLADGSISYLKAKIVADETDVLDDALVAQAEALILAGLAGKTPGQIGKLAAAVVVAVDPKGAQKRRERAERDDARVRFWREQSGTSALAAYGLPTDAALAANASITARARQYKQAKLDGTMDQLRVLAYLDILNAIPAHDRIAAARAEAQARAQAGQDPAAPAGPGNAGTGRDPATPDHGAPGDSYGSADDDSPACEDESADDDRPADADGPADVDGPADGGPADGGPADGEPGDGGPGGGPGGGSGVNSGDSQPAGQPGGTRPALTAAANLTIPLKDLLGLADRPGEAHGLGPLDPALCRDLAAAAARSPHTTWCLTITSPEGHAIGHGCAKPARTSHGKSPPAGNRDGPWALTKHDDHSGPPGGWGTWTLTLPGGRQYDIRLGPIPVTDCDHRHESRGYQPSDLLRHLVQIRDGECTFPCCSRHARESDFEHAIPYDQGGRTCGCNAGARSRRCHKVKQSTGWTVTQPLPGWHHWTTPSGRTYVQGPKQYPA